MNKNYEIISLNGDFRMCYLGGDKYTSDDEPTGESFLIKNAVPSYFEDMGDKFRATEIHTSLKYNPMYTLQRYPQTGYVPDMALPNYLGSFGYFKHFTLQEICAEEYELYVGGVQNSLKAWINGIYVGSHEGYSSDFAIKIPKDALVEGKNRITLVVSNNRLAGYLGRPVSGCTSRAANECTGGIYGDVEIRAYTSSLHDARVIISDDMKLVTVKTDRPAASDYTVEICDGGKVLRSATIYRGKSETFLDIEGLTPWTLSNPKRYECRIRAGESTLSLSFGIRKLTVQDTKLFFNGKPFYVRGICEHGYYPLTVHPPRDKSYFLKVIKKIKALGFNFIRFHTTVPTKEYMEAADELGILMEIETPNNTTYEEWCDIVRFTSRYTAPVMYSSGNEMVIDEEYIEHLRKCAKLVHENTDSLFSPMSAMRGVEYHSYGDCRVDEPFPHNPKRLSALSEFCDVYNSYTLGLLSYTSEKADSELIDARNSIYGKPLLSHEICINGTYLDLSLADRYRGTRIGDTELYSSVERHLEDKGLLSRAPLYYKNSSEWQRRIRKAAFEAARSCKTISGYDFLGDIDHHWHTFGYCVGMMNEFYELKPGETVRSVRQYNSDTVLLATLPYHRNFECGERIRIPISVSHFAQKLSSATLNVRIASESKVYFRKSIHVAEILSASVTELYTVDFVFPRLKNAEMMKLCVSLSGGDTDSENEWEIFVYPKAKYPSKSVIKNSKLFVANDIGAEELIRRMQSGDKVLLFGQGPFSAEKTSFQISLAGRTTGHLATVISENEVMKRIPNESFCSFQFREMMKDAAAIILDDKHIPFNPMIEIATTYKNARREALMFEYRIGAGRLLVCGLNLSDDDAGARYLKSCILEYASSYKFEPKDEISVSALRKLIAERLTLESVNENAAQNKNDITMM